MRNITRRGPGPAGGGGVGGRAGEGEGGFMNSVWIQ